MNWYEVAKPLLKKKKITHKKVAKALGLNSTSAASHKLNGTRGSDLDEIEIIASMLGMTLAELVSEDNSFTKTEDEKELLEVFRVISDKEQKMAIKMIKSLVNESTENKM